ncbi:hypothetical protein N0V93_001474 [Gnomoniopsis smithogilvyi]|uniref:Uncharacterized protein n=1 Tax=Gnomoniopsis smithogilvyi TaxID=1191159 RepID=A0A9W9D2M8_9PEZI|nr:hypothetical protein N0V93_001474 [Gnomoniopsis smithogilvyi]
MASHAQPATAASQDRTRVQEPLIYVPNTRPEGIEFAGDGHWRDWRLRKRRPELRERYTATFPNINPFLEREANARVDTQEHLRFVPFTKRTLHDLREDPTYRVKRLQFRPLQETQDRVDAIWAATRPRKSRPQEELDKLPSFFFEGLCSSLFARVWDFAAETFGQQPAVDARSDAQKETDFDRRLQDTDWTDRFLQHLPPDFIRCVSEVARGDYHNRGWKTYDPHGYEFLFLDRDQRIHLCTAVIAKLLQEQCFDSLLFGARKIERDALGKTDVAQEDIANVPKYLIRDLFTSNFWQEVDRVTLGILDLLLPMINFVGELEPDVGALPLTEVYQQLHNIVAEAGWLANGLALTRSCFWLDFPQPGQLWDVRQEHVTDIVWKASKAFADYNDGIDLENALLAWRQARMHVYDALDDDPKPALGTWSRTTYELDNPRPRLVRRTAKVQISMWPFFERSYPYKQELVSGDFNLGEETTVLQKAQVVYYAGNDSDAGEQQEDYTLKQYLEDYSRRKAIFWGPRAWISWPIVLLLLLLALYFAGHSIRHGYAEIKHSDWGLPGHVVSNWSRPTWEWPSKHWPRADQSTSFLKTPITSSQSADSSPTSKLRLKPPIYTSDVYSTRTWVETRLRSSTVLHGDRELEHYDDRKGSPTTLPTSWTSTGQPSKRSSRPSSDKRQSSRPSSDKPKAQLSQDSSSTTVLPDTVRAPEPTEEPSPVPTASNPPGLSSTADETSTERHAPSSSAKSKSSLWDRIFHRVNTKNETPKGIPKVLQEDNAPIENPTTEEPKSGKAGKGRAESDITSTESDVGVDLVPTGSIGSFWRALFEGKEDSSKTQETTSEGKWLDISEEDEQPAPAFTTEVPPDVAFTDAAKPGVTLNMEEGFWIMIHPLGLEYNCWIKSRTADCTSTIWTTVTAKPTAKPKVTEGSWTPTVERK